MLAWSGKACIKIKLGKNKQVTLLPKLVVDQNCSNMNILCGCRNFCLRLYVPVNKFSVILGRLPGFNQY